MSKMNLKPGTKIRMLEDCFEFETEAPDGTILEVDSFDGRMLACSANGYGVIYVCEDDSFEVICEPPAPEGAFTDLCAEAHRIAVEHGFYDPPPSLEIQCALIASEAMEAFEAVREHNPPSTKIPGFSCAEEELADVCIRTFDTSASQGFDLEGAIRAKMDYNRNRPYRHGDKAF